VNLTSIEAEVKNRWRYESTATYIFTALRLNGERRKASWNGYILNRNSLLKHVIEVKIERTGRRGRKRREIQDDL
jgi:hypothetical protein